MSSLLKFIDIFGSRNNLKINSKDNFQTKEGGLAVVVLLILSTLAFIAFGRDLFEKKVPTVIYSKEVYNETYIEFNNSNIFMFGLMLQSNSTVIKDVDRKYTIYLENHDNSPTRQQKGGPYSIITRVPLVKCSDDRLTDEIKKVLVTPVDSYYCLKKDSKGIIKGVGGVGDLFALRLQVEFCSLANSNRTDCYKPSEIRTLPRIKMHYIFTDLLLDHGDYKSPGKPKLLSDYAFTNGNSFSRLQFWIKNVHYYNDVGWILEDTQVLNYYAVDHIDTVILPDSETTTIFSHLFVGAGVVDSYRRNYIKIQGVFAYIGGFISFFKIILTELSLYIGLPEYINFYFKSFENVKLKNVKTTANRKFEYLSSNNQEVQEKSEHSITNNHLKLVNHNNYVSSKRISESKIDTSKMNNLLSQKKDNNSLVDSLNTHIDVKLKQLKCINEYNKVPEFTLLEKIFRRSCFKWKSLNDKVTVLKRMERQYYENFSVEKLNHIFKDVSNFKLMLLNEPQIKYFDSLGFKEIIQDTIKYV